MIGIGTPNSQSRIPRPINHYPYSLGAMEATPIGCSRMYANASKGVSERLLGSASVTRRLNAVRLLRLAAFEVALDHAASSVRRSPPALDDALRRRHGHRVACALYTPCPRTPDLATSHCPGYLAIRKTVHLAIAPSGSCNPRESLCDRGEIANVGFSGPTNQPASVTKDLP